MQLTWPIVLEVSVGVATIVAAVYGFTSFIDSRIEKKIHDDSVIRKLASVVRPSIIFDENSSVLVDQGALELLESVTVQKDEGSKLPKTITVIPKRHLAHPPLIQTLEVEAIDFGSSRGPGLSWVFTLDYIMCHDDFDGRRRFRLEIL